MVVRRYCGVPNDATNPSHGCTSNAGASAGTPAVDDDGASLARPAGLEWALDWNPPDPTGLDWTPLASSPLMVPTLIVPTLMVVLRLAT